MEYRMRQEEKNIISRKRIMESARMEFARHGYGLGSINTICSEGGISKGILYHYYKDKDEIYLFCLKECFESLTVWLKDQEYDETQTVDERLTLYFSARLSFFTANPDYQKLFCQAVTAPPEHLKKKIEALRKEFDTYNISFLDDILSHATIQKWLTKETAITLFCDYQNFLNADSRFPKDTKEREEACHRAILSLLYGVVSKEATYAK